MFFIPRTNVVESDEGLSVEVLGRTGLRYVEGDRVLLLDSEVLAGSAGLVVYRKISRTNLPKVTPLDSSLRIGIEW